MMFHLPPSTDLAFLVGREIIQIAVGLNESIIHFDSSVSITIMGHCQLDGATRNPGPDAGVALVDLLGNNVCALNIVDGRHLKLEFAAERCLTILEDDEPYESFTISSEKGLIVV